MSATSSLLVETFKDHELINLLIPVTSLPRPPLDSPRLIAESLFLSRICSDMLQRGRLAELEARHLQALAFVCASLRYEDADFAFHLTQRAKALVPQCSPLVLCQLLKSLLLLKGRVINPDAIGDIIKRLEMSISSGAIGSGEGGVNVQHIGPLLPVLCIEAEEAMKADGVGRDEAFLSSVRALTGTVSSAVIQRGGVINISYAFLLLLMSLPGGGSTSMELVVLSLAKKLALELSLSSAPLPIEALRKLVFAFGRFASVMQPLWVESQPIIRSLASALRASCLSRLPEFDPEERPEILQSLILAAEAKES